MALDATEISRLSLLSDEALLAEIGREILREEQPGLQARPPSLRQLAKRARDWLDENNEEIRQAVCRDPKVRAVAEADTSTREQMLKVVADVLGSLAIFVPVGTVAEILVRRGLPAYCETVWQSNT